MSLRVWTAAEFEAALPMGAAIDAMGAAFEALERGQISAPPRGHLPLGTDSDAGDLLLMGARAPGMGAAAKVVTVRPANSADGVPAVQAVAMWFDEEHATPQALVDGAALTAWRTGAVSGLATRLLAHPDARIGAVIGAGVQARTQVLAIDAARELDEIRVYSPTAERREALVRRVSAEARARLVPVASSAAALAGAQIVCTATTSSTPVLAASELAPGALVNAVGTYRLDHRELPRELIAEARVVVDDVESALAEAGELVDALHAGLTWSEEWSTIGAQSLAAAAGTDFPGAQTSSSTLR